MFVFSEFLYLLYLINGDPRLLGIKDTKIQKIQTLKSTRARKKAGFRPLFLLPVNVETWDLEQMIFSFIPKSHKNFEVLAPI